MRNWSRTRRRCLVHRPRSGLRNDHARRRRLRRPNNRGCSGARCRRRRLRRGGSRYGRRCRRGWRNCCRGGRRWTRRRRNRCCRLWCRSRGLLDGRRYDHGTRWSGRLDWRGRGWRSRCGPRRRSHNCGLRCDGRRCRPRRRRNHCFLLLRDGFEHVSRTGDVRQIDLRLDFFFAAQRASGLGSLRRRFRCAADMRAHLLCFVVLERTGMGLLLRHSDERQHVENGFAFNFQLPCEIVDSNLAHPAFLVPRAVP